MEEYTMFQSAGTDLWYVINKDVCSDTNIWWFQSRLLAASPAEFIKVLIDKYKCDNIKYKNNTLIFSWKKYSNANKYKTDLNKALRGLK